MGLFCTHAKSLLMWYKLLFQRQPRMREEKEEQEEKKDIERKKERRNVYSPLRYIAAVLCPCMLRIW